MPRQVQNAHEIVIDCGMAETPADRLRKLRIARGFESAKEAARAFGWNENTYSSHEGGVRGIRKSAAERYAKAYRSTPGFILFGGGKDLPVINKVALAPVVATIAASIFTEPGIVPDEQEPVPIVPKAGIPPGAQYAVKIDGNSVNKRIPHGMYAICAPYDLYPGGAPAGALVHVVRERAGLFEHTIKELRFDGRRPILVPVSTDPKHQSPMQHKDGDLVTIKGVVIGKYEPM